MGTETKSSSQVTQASNNLRSSQEYSSSDNTAAHKFLNEEDSLFSSEDQNPHSTSTEESQTTNLSKITYLYLIMDLGFSDMKKILSRKSRTELDEEHIITIFYN